MVRFPTTILFACALAGAPAAVLAQAYPTKPIRFIVPFPPGGTSDVLGRIVAQRLSDALGRQVVENRGGASRMIGTEAAAKSPGDGYTLLLTSMGGLVTNTFLHKRVPYDALHDFAFVSSLSGLCG